MWVISWKNTDEMSGQEIIECEQKIKQAILTHDYWDDDKQTVLGMISYDIDDLHAFDLEEYIRNWRNKTTQPLKVKLH